MNAGIHFESTVIADIRVWVGREVSVFAGYIKLVGSIGHCGEGFVRFGFHYKRRTFWRSHELVENDNSL